MGLLFQVGDQVFPKQCPELILRSSSRYICSSLVCPLALCTIALDAQVGQEGIGEADQLQVCHGRPVRPVLVLAEPQQLLGIFQPLLDGMISNDKFCCTRWGVLQLSWWRRPHRLRRYIHGRGILLRIALTRRRRNP
jgi:hypothetical protein